MSNIQLKEFGQTPEQIFFKPHPKKYSKKIVEIPLNNNLENKDKSEIKIIEKNNKENKENKEKEENKENKDLDNIQDKKVKDKQTDSIENKQSEDNNKIETEKEKYINNGSLISKPFPINPNLDFKLKKQYNSVKKYENHKLVSGTILPDPNVIISGGINGHLNIYDYYLGEIKKTYSLSCPVENINSINNKNLILYSSDYSINTFNTSLGQNISSFYAHETKIFKLFYDEKFKNIISCTKGGIIHIWDINQKLEIPTISHFLFDQNNIINVDYNKDIHFFYSLDNEGKISILNAYNDEEIYNWKEEDKVKKPISICSNYNNLNEYIIGYEKGFKIFDIRKFSCVEDWTNNIEFEVKKCIMDCSNILIQNDYEIKLFDYKEKKLINERKTKDKIEFFSYYNFSNNDTRIIYGDEKGNIFYSTI